VTADSLYNLVKLRVKQRLAARERYRGRAERRKMIYAADHLFERDRTGEVVVLVAVCAGKVATADGYKLNKYGMARRLIAFAKNRASR
jgi:hypothetical protein